MTCGFDELAKGLAEGLSWRQALGRGVGALGASAREGSSEFDELAKDLARGISRRKALGRFGVGLVGAVLCAAGIEIVGPKAALAQNSNCFYFCKAVYPNDPNAQAACASSGGLCSQCGPAAPAPRRSLCNAPGNTAFCCPKGQICCNGTSCSSGLGQACANSAQCCSAAGLTCAATLPLNPATFCCRQPGPSSACANNGDCCPQGSIFTLCTGNVCCNGLGQGCANNGQCCSGLTCVSTLPGNPATFCCKQPGASSTCVNNGDCCPQGSVFTLCTGNVCCNGASQACANDGQCCSGLTCISGFCTM